MSSWTFWEPSRGCHDEAAGRGICFCILPLLARIERERFFRVPHVRLLNVGCLLLISLVILRDI
jgi:hypothetical protein